MFRAGAGSTRIDVRSVWFLLLYASGYLERLTGPELERLVSGERDNDLIDALAEVLARSTTARMRSMLARGYRARSASLHRVRGRIDHLGTARGRLMESGRIRCTFQEQTADLTRYRYILFSLRSAARSVVGHETRQSCLSAARMLEQCGVRPIDPTDAELSREQFGHADRADHKLVQLARLVRTMSAPEHSPGTVELPAIVHDEGAMRKLFEDAVRGFLRVHLNPLGHSVEARRRAWPASGPAESLAHVPSLNADIIVRSEVRQLVIECKFAPIFAVRFGKTMIKPGYLQQLYAYASVFSRDFDGRTEALLLGALVDGSPGRELDFAIDGVEFHVRQVDLSAPPSTVRAELRDACRFAWGDPALRRGLSSG